MSQESRRENWRRYKERQRAKPDESPPVSEALARARAKRSRKAEAQRQPEGHKPTTHEQHQVRVSQ